jgi:osmoprotectant transport system substrate-binding protein
MRHHRFSALIAGTALALGLSGAAAAQEIVVGGKNFTEQQLMAEMTAQLLRDKGYEVEKRAGMGSAALRQAQENGQIDVYWEYTGTSLIVYNNVEEKLGADETYEKVKELDAEKGLVWLEPSAANNTYALAMQEGQAEEMGIQSLSDLGGKIEEGEDISFALNAEFYARPDGWKPLQETYGFDVARDKINRMDSGLTYQALNEDQVDVALVFATDGRIPAFDFKVLEDDKGYFPSYALTPVVRKEVLDNNPELADHLNELSAKLDDETMANLNAQVDVERKSIEEVAQSFLSEQGLVS